MQSKAACILWVRLYMLAPPGMVHASRMLCVRTTAQVAEKFCMHSGSTRLRAALALSCGVEN